MGKNKKVKNIKSTDENEVKNFIKIVIIVSICFGVCYGGSLLLTNSSLFETGYTPQVLESATISTEDIIIGSVFNRPEKSYYVVFADFSDKEKTTYLNYLLSSTSERVYKVDMSLGINSKYENTSSNKKAQKDSALEINGYTLIKISSGKNTKYAEGIDNIKKELK